MGEGIVLFRGRSTSQGGDGDLVFSPLFSCVLLPTKEFAGTLMD